MNRASRIQELKRLQTQVDELRSELEFSPPGVIWQADSPQGMIVVEADGFGGATTRIVEGNYPIDYCATFGKSFRSEDDAETVALAIARGEVCASRVLNTAA